MPDTPRSCSQLESTHRDAEMDQHLSDSEIERYLDENALASDQERVHGHMAACPSCFATWREIIVAHETLLTHERYTADRAGDAELLDHDVASSTVHDETNARSKMLRIAALMLAASLAVAIVRAFVVGDLPK